MGDQAEGNSSLEVIDTAVEKTVDHESRDGETHHSYKDDPQWADVTPLAQDDGPHPIAQINYTPEFREVYDYLRAVLASNEMSLRAFKLTEHAARLNPANYTVWFYRRKLLVALNRDLDEELRLLAEVIEMHPKNYQIWFHRQKIVELRESADGELQFIESMLEEDSKNYHAWQYRQWLIKTFNLWGSELSFTSKLIQEDMRNNSAWNQRYFVISHTSEYTESVLLKEVLFTLAAIDRDIYNESPWNYLRGIMQNLPSMSEFALPEPYNCSMLAHIRNLLKSRPRLSPYLGSFAVEIFEEQLAKDPSIKDTELMPMLEKLETCDDTVRKNYWKFLRLKIENEQTK